MHPIYLSQTAIYLPSLFMPTVVTASKEGFYEFNRQPRALAFMNQLNIFHQRALWRCRYALISPGSADLELIDGEPQERILRTRDSDTFVLADSGGYQIATGGEG